MTSHRASLSSSESESPSSLDATPVRGEYALEQEDTGQAVDAPWQADQEWANAMTHGIATIASLFFGAMLLRAAWTEGVGMTIACAAYSASVVGTFAFSTLSHLVRPSPRLDRLRAWDQAMIYTMISGTYTPIAYRFCPESINTALLVAIWIAAFAGLFFKLVLKHRVNSIGTVSYLLLGWLPAIPLAGNVPSIVVTGMIVGGCLYTAGVVLLMNDRKLRYLHAGWHLMVMSAAGAHGITILKYVVPAN